MLGLLILGLLACPSLTDIYAVTESSTSQSITRSTANIAISAPARLDLELLPTSSGNTSSSHSSVIVSTTGTGGYELYLAAQKETKLTNLHHEASISSIAKPTIVDQFPNNTWGYVLTPEAINNTTTYQPASAETGAALYSTTTATATDSYNLGVALKADTTLPAGTYYNTLVLSVVAKPPIVFSGITYMQDMTPDICALAIENDTMQLIDKRDNKSYWVAKLKDGNCWMVQNLDLDLSTETTLDSTMSNVASYTPPYDINNWVLDGSPYNNRLNYGQHAWDIGNVVIGTPLEATGCAAYGNSQWNVKQSLKLGDNAEEKCGTQGLVDVSGSEWRPTFTAQLGDFAFNSATKQVETKPNPSGKTWIAVDTSTKTYDAHYLTGNYYQLNALAAGKVSSPISNNSSLASDICPSGWQLPSAGSNGFSSNGSTAYLFRQYGLVTAETAMRKGKIENGEYNLAKAPLYLTRAGYAGILEGYVVVVGETGFYATRTGAGTSGAIPLVYNYHFDGAELDSSYDDLLQYGFTARCLLKN